VYLSVYKLQLAAGSAVVMGAVVVFVVMGAVVAFGGRSAHVPVALV